MNRSHVPLPVRPDTPPKKSLPPLLPGWKHPETPIDTSRLPKLLEIRTKELRERALRHTSHYTQDYRSYRDTRPRYPHELDSYEVLETVGDAYLAMAVTRILRREFPRLSSGPLGELRQELVRNVAISQFSLSYGFPSRMQRSQNCDYLERDQSVAADLFEAHVGGLLEDPQVKSSELDDWLQEIFSNRVWYELDQFAAKLLRQKMETCAKASVPKLVAKGRASLSGRIRWACIKCDSELDTVTSKPNYVYDTFDQRKGWHVKVYYEGKFAGCGHALVKRDAEVAALSNSLAMRM